MQLDLQGSHRFEELRKKLAAQPVQLPEVILLQEMQLLSKSWQLMQDPLNKYEPGQHSVETRLV